MDYSFVPNAARIALYDDMLSSPQIIEVPPANTTNFIGELSSQIYNLSRQAGGGIPFSAIKQVTENFIHADFREIVVSIMDDGNTIRFTDQGPGISDKQRAQLPGFSSATEEMKKYIDGVGSGLPIVREYLDVKHGTLTLDDNLNGGSVVTLSLTPQKTSNFEKHTPNIPTTTSQVSNIPSEIVLSSLSKRSQQILSLFKNESTLGVQDISNMTDIPLSSTHSELRKLEESGIIEKLGKKRILSNLGRNIIESL
ncbi:MULTISPECIES: ATP-binding protein [unclassified Adlercreutzia]|uniref:ATP-binding protein n=1 Tax=unclassified Adlercreutzia TaxID=2636013 RepID=UPI001F152CF0|nr:MULTISPECIES: ATP-binding protein [unclassified Adlercreutzia]